MTSLFRFPVSEHRSPTLGSSLLDDIDIRGLLAGFFEEPYRYLTTDADAISERNTAIKKLYGATALREKIPALYKAIEGLYDIGTINSDIFSMLKNLETVRNLSICLREFCEAVKAAELDGRFSALTADLSAFREKHISDKPERYWQELASGIDNVRSMSYSFAFDKNAEAKSFSLLKVEDKATKQKLFPVSRAKDQFMGFVTVLPRRDPLNLRSVDNSKYQQFNNWNQSENHLMNLLITLHKINSLQAEAVKSYLFKISYTVKTELGAFYDELRFLVGAMNYLQTLDENGLCHCFPETVARENVSITELYHPKLALARPGTVVTNDFKNSGEILLIGGENGAGKTTFLRSVCSVQLLYQLGLPVTASYAVLSPESSIVSVFTQMETTSLEGGKLDAELRCVKAGIDEIEPGGMVLFNEPITATSADECYFLSREVLCILCAKEAHGIFVTHCLRLFDDFGEINHLFGELRLSSAYVKRTDGIYKIREGVPPKNIAAAEVFAAAK